jgi:carboxypeptidase C (cathepsin A)
VRQAAAALLCALLLAAGSARADEGAPPLPAPSTVVTHHTVRLSSGSALAYTATASTLLLRNDKNEPTASIFSVAYTTGDRTRPVTFIYNGGPGSSSVWLQIGAFGPRRIATPDGSSIPPPPYRLDDNPATLLDVSDLVFIDPVGTGYSVAGGAGANRDFWGVDEDLRAFSQFIRRWVDANGRSTSPKYLLGESYGTFRSAGLVNRLLDDGTSVDGVILVSSLLDYGDVFAGPGNENVPDALALPSEAAVAWYHHRVPDPAPDVQTAIARARDFTIRDYLPAILSPGPLADADRTRLAQRMHELIGLDPDYLLRANLRVDTDRFQAQLLRDRGQVIGRYDGRTTGAAVDRNAQEPAFDPSYEAIQPAFTAAFGSYLSGELGWRSDRPYRVLPGDVAANWNFQRSGFTAKVNAPQTIGDLRDALHRNPALRVFAAAGLYDLATPFSVIGYELASVVADPATRARVGFGYYAAGHMIYLDSNALRALRVDIGGFYADANHK